MLIIDADISHAGEILALQKLAFLEEARRYEDDALPPLMQTLEQMREDIERTTVLISMNSGRIAGSVRARLEQGTCYIARLIVHPDFQNCGLGTRLMREIESRFAPARRFELFTGHRSQKNIHLYEKLGYVIYHQERIHDTLTLVSMEKISGTL